MLLARVSVAIASLAAAIGGVSPNGQAACNSSSVGAIVASWDTWPSRTPSDLVVDGPILGNGGLAAAVGAGKYGLVTLYTGLTSFVAGPVDGFSKCSYGDGGLKQVGGLSFGFNNRSPVSFRAAQIIAEGRVHFTVADSQTKLNVDAFVSANEDVLRLRLSFESAAVSALNVTVTAWTVKGCSLPFTVGSTGDTVIFAERVSGPPYQGAGRRGVSLRTADVMVTPVGAVFSGIAPASDGLSIAGTILLPEAGRFSDVVAVVSDGGRQANAALLEASATGAALEGIEQRHREWWSKFWSASCVAFPSQPTWERYWYGSQYLLALNAREGRTAPGLFGALITTDSPGWSSDLTLNYNAQAPYYGVWSSNHVELARAQFQPYIDFLPTGRYLAKTFYGCDGVVFPGHILPGGLTSSDVQTMGQLSDASFVANNFVWHYRHTLDTAWLREVAYPFVREVGMFWKCWLVREDLGAGSYRYVDPNDCINELCEASGGRPAKNPIISLSLIKFVLAALVEWSRALDVDAALADGWADIVAHLSDYPTASVTLSNGQVATVFSTSEGEAPQGPGANPFEVYPMHPVADVSLSSPPELLAVARNTVAHLASWGEGNAFCEIFPAAVRINYNSTDVLLQLNEQLSRNLLTNLYYFEGGGGIEGAGATLALNEMMLQSAEGFVRFFPALDQGARPAAFERLRTLGGFLVSGSIDEAGLVGDITVIATHPAAEKCLTRCDEFVFLSPWDSAVLLVVTDDRARRVDLEQRGDGRFSFRTLPGASYHIVALGAGSWEATPRLLV